MRFGHCRSASSHWGQITSPPPTQPLSETSGSLWKEVRTSGEQRPEGCPRPCLQNPGVFRDPKHRTSEAAHVWCESEAASAGLCRADSSRLALACLRHCIDYIYNVNRQIKATKRKRLNTLSPANHFTNRLRAQNLNLVKTYAVLTRKLTIQSSHSCVYGTKIKLPWHVRTYDLTGPLKSKLEQK